jgi:hypothetical protein
VDDTTGVYALPPALEGKNCAEWLVGLDLPIWAVHVKVGRCRIERSPAGCPASGTVGIAFFTHLA